MRMSVLLASLLLGWPIAISAKSQRSDRYWLHHVVVPNRTYHRSRSMLPPSGTWMLLKRTPFLRLNCGCVKDG